MDVSNVWTAWPIVGPCLLSPLAGGTNKSIWLVRSLIARYSIVWSILYGVMHGCQLMVKCSLNML